MKNCCYWADSNSHIFYEVHIERPQKWTVWPGIFGDCTVGPLFLEGNLIEQIYLQHLEDTINPLITDIIENDLLIFQQDEACYFSTIFVPRYLPNDWILTQRLYNKVLFIFIYFETPCIRWKQ